MAKNAIKEELIKALSSADGSVRHNAIVSLGEINDPDVVPHLEKLCNHGDPATRYFAKKTIKKIRDAALKEENRPVEKVLEESFNLDFLKNSLASPNPEARLKVLKSVALKPLPGMLQVLVEKIGEEQDPFVIATMVKLIGKNGGPEQIDIIKKYLTHEDLRIRANAIEGLEMIGTEKIIPFVVPFLNDLDNRIRANAVKAMSKFSMDETFNVLRAMIKSEHLWMRDSAIFALSQINSDSAIDLIGSALYDKDRTISNHAMQTLLKIASPQALKHVDEFREKAKSSKSSVELLRGSIKKASETVAAAEGADMAASVKPDAAMPVEDMTSSEKNAEIIALGKDGGAEAVVKLEKFCVDQDPAVRYFARKTLKAVKENAVESSQAAPPAAQPSAASASSDLRKALSSGSPEERLKHLKEAQAAPKPEMAPVLVERLAVETDVFVLATIIRLLGAIGGVENIDHIKKFLSHDDLRVRANAIEALEYIGSEKIIPLLVPFLNDSDNRIKANAVKALAKFNSAQMINFLSAMIRSDLPWMRDSAVYALSQMKGDEPVALLGGMLNENDQQAAAPVLQALMAIGTPQSKKIISDYNEKTSRPRVPAAAQAPEPQFQAPPPQQQAAVPLQAAQHPPAEPAPPPADSGQQASGGSYDKLKATMKKNEDDLIFIVKDADSFLSMGSGSGLDDNILGYLRELPYIVQGVAPGDLDRKPEPRKEAVRKQQAEEKKEASGEFDEILPQKVGQQDAGKLTAEMKKKIVLEQLKANKSKGKKN